MPFSTIPIGTRYMLLSAFGFALTGACVKICSNQGIPVMEIIAARAIVSLSMSYLDIRRKGIPFFGNNKWLLFLRGLIGLIALTCVFYGIAHLPLAEATVLQYLNPMFTALLALLFLKERPNLATLTCIILSFAGLIIMVRPDFLFNHQDNTYNTFAVLIAIAGAFGSGIAYTLVRKLCATEDPSVIVMYFPLICLPFSVLFSSHNFVMPLGWTWLFLFLVGAFTQLGQVTLTLGMRTETASRATSLSYSQVVFATLLGIVFFQETPDALTVLGASMIVMGGMITIFWKPKSFQFAK